MRFYALEWIRDYPGSWSAIPGVGCSIMESYILCVQTLGSQMGCSYSFWWTCNTRFRSTCNPCQQCLGPGPLSVHSFSLVDLWFHYLTYFTFTDWRWPKYQLCLACPTKNLLIKSHSRFKLVWRACILPALPMVFFLI